MTLDEVPHEPEGDLPVTEARDGVVPLRRADIPSALELLCQAFDLDPWMNFVAKPDKHRRDRIGTWLRRGLVRQTFPFGEVYRTASGSGVALWVPPHRSGRALTAELELRWSLLQVAGIGRVERVRAAIRQIVAAEPPRHHMELRLLAVRPESQRRGVASSLVRPMLDRCDKVGLPVALLCTSEANVPLYEHLGFEVSGELRIPGGPTLWQMLRPATGSIPQPESPSHFR